MTGAPTIGVVAGGPLLDILGWRSVFAIFGVIGLIATVLAIVVVKPIQRRTIRYRLARRYLPSFCDPSHTSCHNPHTQGHK